MTEMLQFSHLYEYDLRATGITIPLVIKSGPEMVQVNAKIDTGSTYCIFERKQAELLNIDIETGEPLTIGTATGTFLAYGHEVTLWAFGLTLVATVFFCADENMQKNILGRNGWLNRVKLGLIDYEGKLYLSPYGTDGD